MQKTRSIFVKVLVLVCALCCSLAFVFGLTGCSDESEPVDVGVVTITKIEAAGDQIKITYSDGKIVYCDKNAATTCDHELKKYPVKAATCVDAEEFLFVCDKGCGYADIEYGELDADNHVVDVNNPAEEYVEEVKPTCTEQGSIKVTCACGEVLANNPNVPALGHTFERDPAVGIVLPTCEVDGYKKCADCEFVEEASDANGLKATGHDAQYEWIEVKDLTGEFNVCVDGGHEVYACPTCFAKCPECEEAIADTQEIPAVGHAWTNDWTVVAPTLEAAGSFSGYCDVCKTNATIVLPALNDEDYNVSETKVAQCYAKGEDTYVFVYYGNEIAKCTFVVETEAAHVDAAGHSIDKNKVYNMTEFLAANGELEVDSVATCLDEAQGALYCKICNGLVIVNVIGGHQRGDEIVEKYVAPTCVSEGKRYYECTREGCTHEDYDILPMLSHNLVVTPDETNKKLVITCAGNPEGTECTYSQIVDMVDYGYDTVGATCYTDGSKTFWYIEEVGGAKKYLDPVTIPAYGHYYGSTDNKLIKDKEYTYDELVAIFGEANIGDEEGYACVTEVDSTSNCSESANAVAYCSECHGMVIFKALGNHVWKETGSFNATCTEDAYKTYVCEANAEHTKTVVDEGSALGHEFVLDLENSVIGTEDVSMVFVCSRGCGETETVVGEIIEDKDVDSTCLTHGYHYITYKYLDANDPTADAQGYVTKTKYLIEEKPLSTVHFYEGEAMDQASYTYSELVDIFGAANIGKVEGFKLVTEVDSAFDCQNSAQAVYYCTVCGGMKIITATGDHAWGNWTEIPATCTEESYKYRQCTVEGCDGYEAADETYVPTPATGHTYVYELPEASALIEGSYDMVVTCEDCDYTFTFKFNQFNDVDYVKNVVAPNSCASEGLTTYTIDIKDGNVLVETKTFSVTTPVTEHEGAEPPVEKTWEHDGYIYEGYYCEACNQMIITKKTEIPAE